MIDTKDLMIGNWVKVVDNGFQNIASISAFEECELMALGRVRKSENLDPIPVTPELLERIGFKREFNSICNEYYWSMAIGADYYLDINNPPRDEWHWYIHIDGWDRDTLGGGYFLFLHKLQNLVRVITGHDLPITKEMLG